MLQLQKYLKGDKIIWGVIIILSLMSMLAVYSSTGTLAFKYQGGNTTYYVIRHVTFMILGLAVVYLTHLFDYKFFSRITQIFIFQFLCCC